MAKRALPIEGSRMLRSLDVDLSEYASQCRDILEWFEVTPADKTQVDNLRQVLESARAMIAGILKGRPKE